MPSHRKSKLDAHRLSVKRALLFAALFLLSLTAVASPLNAQQANPETSATPPNPADSTAQLAAFVARLVAATDEQRKSLLEDSQHWDSRQFSDSLTKQSRRLLDQQNYSEARRVALILCQIGAMHNDPYSLASCYFEQGQVDLAKDDAESAIRDYHLAKEQFRLADDPRGQMISALSAARADRTARRPDDFQKELHEAEQLRDKLHDPYLAAMFLFYNADANSQVDDRSETLASLEASARIADAIDTKDGKKLSAQIHLRIGDVLFGGFKSDTDDMMRSVLQFEKAYAFARDADDESLKARGMLARTHTLLTWCVMRRTVARGSGSAHPAFADVCLEAVDAFQLALHSAGGQVSLQVEPLWRLGDVYRYLGRLDDSRKSYESAQRIAISERDFSSVAIADHEIGKILAAESHWREALDYYRNGIEAVDHFNAEAPRKSFESRLQTHSKLNHELHSDMARALIELSSDDPKQIPLAFEVSEQAKSRMLVEVLTRPEEDISALLTPDEKRRENDLQRRVLSARADWERARSQSDLKPEEWDAADHKFHEALRDRQLFEEQVYSLHGRKKPTEKPELATLLEVNRLIYDASPATAILSYVVGADQVLLFVLTRGETLSSPARVTPYVFVLDSQTDYAISQFHDKCAAGEPSRKESDLLYKALIQPAEKVLSASSPQIQHLIIVPDGSLHQVPFQALSDTSHSFLIQRYEISYAPSVTSLLLMHNLARQRQRERSAQQSTSNSVVSMLAVGGPIMPKGYSDLKFSGEEANEVAALFHSVALTGKDANAGRVKTEMPRARFVHLATHGVLYEDSPMRSGIVLSQDGNLPNFLEVRDLIRMSLKAEMVVVSTCNSANGTQVAGEGPVGLMWAFFAAKTPTTVVTLWSIDDAGTGKLMVDFYKGIKDGGLDKAAALRQAQLNMIQQRAPIRLWAPFIVAGDWTN